MTQAPSSPHRAWRSKWRGVSVYWLAQALVTHFAVAGLMWDDGLPQSFSDMFNRVDNGGLILLDGIAVGIVTLMQAVLLLPVQRPGVPSSSVWVRGLHCGICATTIAAISWLFLWPVAVVLESLGLYGVPTINSPMSFTVPAVTWLVCFSFLWARRSEGVPVLVSVLIAALGAALLASGLAGAICSIVDLATGQEHREPLFFAMLATGSIAWIVFTPLILAFCRKGRPESVLAKFAARLFIGTIVEAAAIIPLDVMVRKKLSCHCEQGTFWALTFCWGVGALALGPVVFLLPFTRRRKRWYAGLCDACDYDMTGCLDAERCPECGAGWKGKAAASEARVTS